MLKKVKDCVRKYEMIVPGDYVVAGVSGGADSVCLFFVLLDLQKEISFELTVVHVDHGIRSEAGADAEFVRALCEKYSVLFLLYKTDIKRVAKERRISEEEAGRDFRYECFRQAVQNAGVRGKIAVAHHQEDRAETLLFNLFRGSGLRGLASILPVRDNIIRPLLFIRREEIVGFLDQRHLTFCVDQTNEEDIYTRNRIRHHFLPLAEEINGNAVRHMSDAAEYIQEAERYIVEQAERVMEGCVTEMPEQILIELKGLREQDVFLQKTVFMRVLERLISGRKNIGKVHIDGLADLASRGGSGEIHLPGGYRGLKRYEQIIIEKKVNEGSHAETESGDMIFPLGDLKSLRIPNMGILTIRTFSCQQSKIIPEKAYTKWFDYDKITTSAIFRTRRPGDYLIINQTGNRKSIKQYMIDEKIIREKRHRMFLLADASHIMWIPGGRISEHYKVTGHTETILEITWTDDKGVKEWEKQ